MASASWGRDRETGCAAFGFLDEGVDNVRGTSDGRRLDSVVEGGIATPGAGQSDYILFAGSGSGVSAHLSDSHSGAPLDRGQSTADIITGPIDLGKARSRRIRSDAAAGAHAVGRPDMRPSVTHARMSLLAVWDVAVVMIAVGLGGWRCGIADSVGGCLICVVLAVCWLLGLRLMRAAGWRRIVFGSVLTWGAVSMVALAAGVSSSLAGFIVLSLPIGVVCLMAGLWCRDRYAYSSVGVRGVVVIGSLESVADLVGRLDRDAGYAVSGLCVPAGSGLVGSSVAVGGWCGPVIGEVDGVRDAVVKSGASVVVVSSANAIDSVGELSWQLDGLGVDVMVASGPVDVVGSRVRVRSLAGLSMLQVDGPLYESANGWFKTMFDRVGALLLVVVVFPVLVICAIAVKVESRGPVFYRAPRIGLNNMPFVMWKFRSMVVGADRLMPGLVDMSDGNDVLFKMREDPRVTRVGRVLRRLSLDELPQLLNVVGGSMSLVGPRPPLPSEVAQYDARTARRMLVRPGMTGLWQVSGRSDLSWDESVRLDLLYVENWSIRGDLGILWRTTRAVVCSHGAY